MSHGHLQIGYHGCDIAVRDGLVSGKLEPTPSNNQYDWLGPGFYLFEGDHERALAFAQAAASEPLRRFTARPISSPAVVGCIFSLQRCLDMTTNAGRLEFENAYLRLQATNLCSGKRIPMNLPVNPLDDEVLLRGLDRAVFQVIHSKLFHFYGFEYFQAVRGAVRPKPRRHSAQRVMPIQSRVAAWKRTRRPPHSTACFSARPCKCPEAPPSPAPAR